MINVQIADLSVATLGLTTGVGTGANAATAAGEIDTAIDTVAAARADVGAQMSRFEYHTRQLSSAEENLGAAQSAIVDADVAEEQATLASAEVKTEASIAALAQANDMPKALLSLLR